MRRAPNDTAEQVVNRAGTTITQRLMYRELSPHYPITALCRLPDWVHVAISGADDAPVLRRGVFRCLSLIAVTIVHFKRLRCLTRTLCAVAVLGLPATSALAQTGSQAAEIAQLRAELQRALVRIEMLERVILSGAPAAVSTPASTRGLMTPSLVDGRDETVRQPAPPAPAAVPASAYIRGPKGGCYTYTASGRTKYVDHSFCGGG